MLIEELLSDWDIILIHSKNGKETVEICKENKNISLVLMDIKMPVLDGYSAAKQIKQFNPTLPIIAQTAYALDYERKIYMTGVAFDDYLTKPISKEHLKTVIKKFVNCGN